MKEERKKKEKWRKLVFTTVSFFFFFFPLCTFMFVHFVKIWRIIVVFHHFRLIIVCDKSWDFYILRCLYLHRSISTNVSALLSAHTVQPIYEFTKRNVSIFIIRAERDKSVVKDDFSRFFFVKLSSKLIRVTRENSSSRWTQFQRISSVLKSVLIKS
jgi:predicted choloylglycine hydrolase